MSDTDRVIALGRLALLFGRKTRATFHEDGVTPESDTDHTVMLSLVACALCPDHLDRGLVAQYALVHDLVEAYAGDTNTAFITEEGLEAKEKREAEALERIEREFYCEEWMLRTIHAYEAQSDPESRYVRYLDKAMPKVTHVLNGMITMKKMGRSLTEVQSRHARQVKGLSEEYPEINGSIKQLLIDLMSRAEKSYDV